MQSQMENINMLNEDNFSYYPDIYNGIEEPCPAERRLNIENFLQLFIHPIICFAGLIGNTLVIVTYAFYKRTKSMTDVYLLNVAIADILFVVALPLIIYSEQYGWTMGNLSCKLLRGIYSVNVYSGILLLACISGDRYLAIVQARRSFRLRSSTLLYSHLVCAVVWVLALLLSLPTFLFYERYQPGAVESSITDGDDREYVCFFSFNSTETARRMKTVVPSSQVAMGFFLPLLIMGFCYTSVIVTLLRAKNFQRHKAVRVVLTVVFVFVVCHMPYNIALLYYTINIFEQQECSHEEALSLTMTITKSLAYLHSCLNPLLYAFIGVNFRNHFRKILRDIWCLGKNYMSARRSSRVTTEIYISTRRSIDGSANDNGTSFTM
ncbi:C-C chemokine receptor type 6a isoform X2 [Pseudorasbora parva]|uniref:C-C chemokine receptor type 6a isoform X2 n=1 Tax=Pseudorasbora parva TaxID=51549 RepID=UPI00351E4635